MASPVYPPGQKFLDALTPLERREFAAAASERTFPRNSTPMREGDRADYVLVILEGWVRLSVHEHGKDRTITERGPGQLIGEVGTLRVNARSATVTVVETVRALMMRTSDFAVFLSQHARVRSLVEEQIDERLTEEPYRWNAFPPDTTGPATPAGENWSVVYTDIVGFGAHERTARHRRAVRTANFRIMEASFGHLWENCIWKDTGDGLLIVVSPSIPTASIIERLHREVPGKIQAHNRASDGPARIRLRVAVDVGQVMTDTVGLTGDTIIHASRMLDAPVLRNAVAATTADVGLIVSAFVYDNAVKNADGWADPEAYESVEAHVKESRIPAWMRLYDAPPDVTEHRGSLTADVRDLPPLAIPLSHVR